MRVQTDNRNTYSIWFLCNNHLGLFSNIFNIATAYTTHNLCIFVPGYSLSNLPTPWPTSDRTKVRTLVDTSGMRSCMKKRTRMVATLVDCHGNNMADIFTKF